MTISNFQLSAGSLVVAWTANGASYEKRYMKPVCAVELSDSRAVLVVEPTRLPNNAVIYEENGAERIRVANPLAERGAICFSECGYEGADLTLIIRMTGAEFAYVIDEHGRAKTLQEIR